jgi:hypothetical protein
MTEADKVYADAALYGTGYSVGGVHFPIDKVIDMTKEMPVYICHKRVRALEIRSIGAYRASATDKDGLEREIVFADLGFPRIWVISNMFVRYTPMPGDYYVVYEDGYQSFSPRKAFLDGYTPEGQIIQRDKTEADRLRDILRQCPRGPDFVDLGNGETMFLHLPNKGGLAAFTETKSEKADPDKA